MCVCVFFCFFCFKALTGPLSAEIGSFAVSTGRYLSVFPRVCMWSSRSRLAGHTREGTTPSLSKTTRSSRYTRPPDRAGLRPRHVISQRPVPKPTVQWVRSLAIAYSAVPTQNISELPELCRDSHVVNLMLAAALDV